MRGLNSVPGAIMPRLTDAPDRPDYSARRRAGSRAIGWIRWSCARSVVGGKNAIVAWRSGPAVKTPYCTQVPIACRPAPGRGGRRDPWRRTRAAARAGDLPAVIHGMLFFEPSQEEHGGIVGRRAAAVEPSCRRRASRTTAPCGRRMLTLISSVVDRVRFGSVAVDVVNAAQLRAADV